MDQPFKQGEWGVQIGNQLSDKELEDWLKSEKSENYDGLERIVPENLLDAKGSRKPNAVPFVSWSSIEGD